MRILQILPGPVPPSAESARNAQSYLSVALSGDVIATTWARTVDEAERIRRDTADALGAFRYHAARSPVSAPALKFVWTLSFFIRTGLALSRTNGPYDAVVAYGPFTTGIAAYCIARLTGAALIIDMPGHPYAAFAFYGRVNGAVKRFVAKMIVPRLLSAADGVKLLYAEQLADITLNPRTRTAVFHDFTPIGQVRRRGKDDKIVLLLGFPLRLKGADTLIAAFLRIAEDVPEHRLLIVGHAPDRAVFEQMAANHPRIEFRPGVEHREAISLIERCSVLALPSRTEGVPRVIMEGFAAGKPVIASRVGGIPSMMSDGVEGLLIEPGDVNGLADALRQLLRDPRHAERMGDAAHRKAQSYTEQRFASQYAQFIGGVVGDRRRARMLV